MTVSEEKPTLEKQIEDMKATIDKLDPLIQLVQSVAQEPEGLDAAGISDRQWAWGEHQGNVLGADMTKFLQDNSPRFAAAVSTTVDALAGAYFGMMNADSIINGRKLGWLKPLIYVGIPSFLAFILLTNPATSVPLMTWLGTGLNPYIALFFISAIVFMVFLGFRRGQPESA